MSDQCPLTLAQKRIEELEAEVERLAALLAEAQRPRWRQR